MQLFENLVFVEFLRFLFIFVQFILTLLETKVNSNCLLVSKRARERESRLSPVVSWGLFGGAMALGKLSY